MNENDDNDYEVGYRKPPKNTRWQKGQSGNPKGREVGLRNLKTDVKEMLSMQVQMNTKGRTMPVSTQLAALFRLRELALGGNPKALDRMFSLAAQYNSDSEAMPKALGEEDAKLLKIAQRRFVDGSWDPDGSA